MNKKYMSIAILAVFALSSLPHLKADGGDVLGGAAIGGASGLLLGTALSNKKRSNSRERRRLRRERRELERRERELEKKEREIRRQEEQATKKKRLK